MYNKSGFGRGTGSGNRGSMGFGFRGSSPPWPYVGRGRGGLPRCAYYTGAPSPAVPAPGAASMTREEELNLLKRQAQDLNANLERINSRLRDLESEKQRN